MAFTIEKHTQEQMRRLVRKFNTATGRDKGHQKYVPVRGGDSPRALYGALMLAVEEALRERPEYFDEWLNHAEYKAVLQFANDEGVLDKFDVPEGEGDEEFDDEAPAGAEDDAEGQEGDEEEPEDEEEELDGGDLDGGAPDEEPENDDEDEDAVDDEASRVLPPAQRQMRLEDADEDDEEGAFDDAAASPAPATSALPVAPYEFEPRPRGPVERRFGNDLAQSVYELGARMEDALDAFLTACARQGGMVVTLSVRAADSPVTQSVVTQAPTIPAAARAPRPSPAPAAHFQRKADAYSKAQIDKLLKGGALGGRPERLAFLGAHGVTGMEEKHDNALALKVRAILSAPAGE